LNFIASHFRLRLPVNFYIIRFADVFLVLQLRRAISSISVKRSERHYATRNSSGDEIANVNFLYDHIVHAPQNTINSSINSATDRRGYVSEYRFTKFSEITQCNGHYAVQGHSRSPILVPIESSYATSY